MTKTDKLYYSMMLKKGRLIPFFLNDDLICFISFYIANNPDKYIQRDNPWSVEEDEPETGKIAYIDQIWSTKQALNHFHSFQIWNRLVNFIKTEYPLVQAVRWNRWKNSRLYAFAKSIGSKL